VLLPAAEGNFALREAIRANLDPVKYRFLLLGLVLVLIMSFRPEGLLPSKERAEELHAGEQPNVPIPEEDAAEIPSDEEVELR
jgi:branched-chain amino acid transport system permease protein